MRRWGDGLAKGIRAAAVLGTAFAVLAGAVRAQDLVLTNANMLDPSSRTLTEGSLVIRAGKVAQVGSDLTLPDDVETVDLAGRWVIPGLFDMHTHSFGNASPGGAPQVLGPARVAGLALYAGVIGFLDLFSPEDAILGVRDRQRAGQVAGADIFAAGPCLTATGGHCSEYGVPTRLVDSPVDARREIAELAPKRPDVIKLVYDNNVYRGRSMPTVNRETMEAVVAAAHQHGFKAIIHVGTWQDLMDAVEAGADAVTHTPGPDPVPDGLAELMVEKGTLHIPTLAVQSELGRIADDPSLLERPLLAEMVPAELLDAYRNSGSWPAPMQGFTAWVQSLRGPNLEAVAALAAAGVRMGTGTDGGNPGIFQGYSVHREMELLVEAGLSEWDAMAAATTAAARFLGRDWGVHSGAEATLIVLDASPLESITNTQRIHSVIQRGVVVDRSSLR